MSNVRKVLGPGILDERQAVVDSHNIWYFISSINRQLRNNPIKLDGTIDATINEVLDEDAIGQIIGLYKEAGWPQVSYKYMESHSWDYSNTTVFTFDPNNYIEMEYGYEI